ncbi:monooxygenase [Asanoa sp. WMMD1127]|uniref:monooxygenase n=1 Tax=Asanoa sp. WMMD1127 TaxID=3016107 RepID=UPI0024173D31|nr:monooxygenase [Asanoa sp. WMMD1127]MDG4824851.1 monooxygenase [Asanoa sp. WMMD1127]
MSRRSVLVAVLTICALALVACGADGGDGGGGASPPPPSGPASAHAGHGGTPPPAQPLRAGERFVEAGLDRPFTPDPPADDADEYRCFVVDPELTAPAFLTGSEFLPQNRDIVHHAIFFRVSPDDAKRVRAHDAATDGDGWRCFGDAGIGGSPEWVASWAPGSGESIYPAGVGFELGAGSLLVMQIHYSLLATGGKAGAADRSGIKLRLAGGDRTPLRTTLLPAPVELPCAPGESGELCDRDRAVADVVRRFGDQAGQTADGLSRLCGGAARPGPTQSCERRVTRTAKLYGVGGHMHLLGRSIKVELNPGTPQARTLLDVPTFNFDDQAVRPVGGDVTVKPGDTYRVTCTHDAGLRQRLPALRKLPPRYVVWGEGTADEMCLAVVVEAPAA